MEIYLVSQPLWLLGPTIIIVGIALSLGGLYLTRRLVSHNVLKENNDAAGFVYSAVAVLYAVLLAFTIIVVWEQLDASERNVESEASTLAEDRKSTRLNSSHRL